MRPIHKYLVFLIAFISVSNGYAQHHSEMTVEVNTEKKTLNVIQELTYYNQSNDTLNSIILNDWNNAYSSKKSLLAARFSDEFSRSFHLASEEERGSTSNLTIIDQNKLFLNWSRYNNEPDLIEVKLRNKLLPNQKLKIYLTYVVKVPSNEFTNYGYGENGEMNLKDWFIVPSRSENHGFATYSNANIDDIANAISDYDLNLSISKNYNITTDLDVKQTTKEEANTVYKLNGLNRSSFSLFLNPKSDFKSFNNGIVNVETNLDDNSLNDIQKSIIIDKVVNYTNENIGKYPFQKITVSQDDYDRNPFYGLNQLPSFIRPFSDEFVYEIKFLKTYLNNYLKNTLHLDPRKDNWIYDGIQVYYMMKYIDENYPESKMMGSLSKLKILKSYNIFTLDFNKQYSYYYMLMARKNLDQPIGNPKNTLIKFNEKIAGKYRAGLSLKYLDNYLENDIVSNSIKEFYAKNNGKQTLSSDFETILKSKSNKNIDWYFETIINSRKIIDYKFTSYSKTKDSVTFTIKNKTKTTVPISVYGLKDKKIVFKKWLENIKTDSTFTLERKNADKIVLNYNNEVPEYNLRNNWKKISGFFPNNRPIKFALMKDLEDPYYNQILYVPVIGYNLYDGVTFGMDFHNSTILNKPFVFDIQPNYATITRSLTGVFSLAINQYNRDSRLYNIKYGISGSISHYAPDASYSKYNPFVSFTIRNNDYRSNKKQYILLREVAVNREKSAFVTTSDTENYSVFDARYTNINSEITKTFRYSNDIQIAQNFGKISGTIEYRKLFENNRQLNLRFFGGMFLYKNTPTDFFSFALDRPTDYLFDYDYIGRSETTGLFSQQLIIAEGGFKTKTLNPYANQWITTINGSVNIWNWIELYGDVGGYKNTNYDPRFIYDSGIRLNLVTDYFELYFPVYSSNGWDISNNYSQKIRFVVSLNPNTLIGLFTRKWF